MLKNMHANFQGPNCCGLPQSFFLDDFSKMHLKFWITIQIQVNLKIKMAISREPNLLFTNGKKYDKIQMELYKISKNIFFDPRPPPVALNLVYPRDQSWDQFCSTFISDPYIIMFSSVCLTSLVLLMTTRYLKALIHNQNTK